jgi:phosphatidylglycerophosphatase B
MSPPTPTVPAPPTTSARGRIALALALMFAWVLLSFVLLDIPLNSGPADLAVRVSDSADWDQLPFWAAAALALVVSRPGLRTRRRVVEAVALTLAMLIALAGNAWLNENVIKPTFAVPRPNIVALTEAHALGAGIHDPADFYARGDKSERSELLRLRLAKVEQPALSPLVREHWIVETGYAFPSGHATVAMTFASLLVALGFAWGISGWRKWFTNTLVPIWAVCVVYSRPLLEVHSAVDVSVGTLVGFAWGLGAFACVRWAANTFGGELKADARGPTPV